MTGNSIFTSIVGKNFLNQEAKTQLCKKLYYTFFLKTSSSSYSVTQMFGRKLVPEENKSFFCRRKKKLCNPFMLFTSKTAAQRELGSSKSVWIKLVPFMSLVVATIKSYFMPSYTHTCMHTCTSMYRQTKHICVHTYRHIGQTHMHSLFSTQIKMCLGF